MKLVVFSGLPGTGKSALAERLSRRKGWPVFSVAWIVGALDDIVSAERQGFDAARGGRGGWAGENDEARLAEVVASVKAARPDDEQRTRQFLGELARSAGSAGKPALARDATPSGA